LPIGLIGTGSPYGSTTAGGAGRPTRRRIARRSTGCRTGHGRRSSPSIRGRIGDRARDRSRHDGERLAPVRWRGPRVRHRAERGGPRAPLCGGGGSAARRRRPRSDRILRDGGRAGSLSDGALGGTVLRGGLPALRADCRAGAAADGEAPSLSQRAGDGCECADGIARSVREIDGDRDQGQPGAALCWTGEGSAATACW